MVNQCKLLLRNLDQFSQLFDSNAATSTKLQLGKGGTKNAPLSGNGMTTSKITINMTKVKNKKTVKKVQKLKEFTSNSHSYLLVILF